MRAWPAASRWGSADLSLPPWYGLQNIRRRPMHRTMASDQTRATPERLYRLLADNATDVVTLHDVTGSYRYVSPSITSLTGYACEELLGTPSGDLVHPDDIGSVRDQMATMDAHGVA